MDSSHGLLIEIPRGCKNKYESKFDASGNRSYQLTRTVPVPYAAAYGCIPGTLAPDGDESDVFVIGITGSVGQSIAWDELDLVGKIEMTDGSDQDDKLIYAIKGTGVEEIWQELGYIISFLKVYKIKPSGSNPIKLTSLQLDAGFSQNNLAPFLTLGVPFGVWDQTCKKYVFSP